MMPKPHFSWSQFNVYDRDPETYFTQYVLGVPVEETPPMMLGSLFHKCAELVDEVTEEDVEKRVMALGLTPNYTKGIMAALAAIPRFKEREVCVTVDCPWDFVSAEGPLKFLGYFDGYDDGDVHEYKTGSAWNQARVDSSEQITFYAMLEWMRNRKRPRSIYLHHIDLPKGKVTTWKTRRTVKDIKAFQEKRLFPVLSLIHKGVFHKL